MDANLRPLIHTEPAKAGASAHGGGKNAPKAHGHESGKHAAKRKLSAAQLGVYVGLIVLCGAVAAYLLIQGSGGSAASGDRDAANQSNAIEQEIKKAESRSPQPVTVPQPAPPPPGLEAPKSLRGKKG